MRGENIRDEILTGQIFLSMRMNSSLRSLDENVDSEDLVDLKEKNQTH